MTVVAWTLAVLFFSTTCLLFVGWIRGLRRVFDLRHQSNLQHVTLLSIDRLFEIAADSRVPVSPNEVKLILARYDQYARLDFPGQGLHYCLGCQVCGAPAHPPGAYTCGSAICAAKCGEGHSARES